MRDDSIGTRVCPACGKRYASDARFCTADGRVLRDEGSDDDWLIGTVVGERYRVERLLGRGGMGVVYLAQQIFMDRPCALKVLRPESLADPVASARFVREAKNACRIAHPNVAAVYDFSTSSDGIMYLAMEYVDGRSLASILSEDGPLSIARTVSIISQAAAGLEAAHALGIVHRDLKPDNIMIVGDAGSREQVKIVDFGIARAYSEEGQGLTSSKVLIGTPAYMSPEQIAGDVVDARTDIYSLGLVTYAMLAGSLPFGAGTTDVMLRFLEEPKPLRVLAPDIDWPPALEEVLARAVASTPGERHASIQQFARELALAVEGWPAFDASAVRAARAASDHASDEAPSGARNAPELSQMRSGRQSSRARTPIRRRRYVAFGLVTGATVLGILGAVALRSGPTRRGALAKSPGYGATVANAPSSPVPLVTHDSVGDSEPPSTQTVPVPLRPSPRVVTRKTAPPRTETEPEPPRVSATISGTAIALHDSAPSPAPQMTPPVPVARPATAAIRLGSPPSSGASLYVNDEPRGLLSGLRVVDVPVGIVRLRLHIDLCQNWDTVLSVRAGDTVLVGIRRPICRE